MDASPSTCFLSALPNVAVPHVLSVTQNGDGVSAIWNFDTNVAGVTNGNGLWIDTQPPDSGISITGPKQVTCIYSTGVSSGSSWLVQNATPGLTFVGGGVITPGTSGSVP